MDDQTKRQFILGVASTTVFAQPALAASPIVYKFSPGVIEDALRQGRTVVAAYHAFWCSVCRRQERVIERIRRENPAYGQLYFVRIEWDDYRDLPVALDRDVFERSTILILKGEREVNRVFAATSVRKIKSLLDEGVSAARGS
ncbi:MAG: thioredoxin family protein [Pseudomonadota bacterium]